MVEMENTGEVERVLVPFFGGIPPKKAREAALKRTKKGGKLFILHVADETMIRKLKNMWGQVGEKSEIVKNVRESQENIQEDASENFFKKTRREAAKQGVSVEPIYRKGDIVDATLEAISENNIQLVVMERIKERVAELLLGDELKTIKNEAPCEALILS